MSRTTNKFIYEFLLIFLIMLLCMFGMHYWLVEYTNSPEREASAIMFDTDSLFKANLFVIDLCLLIIAESLLILLFYRFTLPSIGISCIGMVLFLSFRSPIENTRIITNTFSPFISNKYAFLETSDFILLLIINTVMLAFLMTVLLKEAELKDVIVKDGGDMESSKVNKPIAGNGYEKKD